MTSTDSLLARRQAALPQGVAQFTGPFTAASADGAIIIDADGRDFIDFTSGIGVMNVGHCNEAVVRAIREQAEKLLHVCIHVATYEPYVALCERLAHLLPHGDHTKAMLVNSGAEAVENAIKIARQATGRAAVICFTESFHGRTLLCATMTSKVGYKIGCGPFAPEIYRLRFPDHFRYGEGVGIDRFAARELRALESALHNVVRAEDVAAILIEPVQGEGGFTPVPAPFLRGLREICDRHGIVLIFDEVQSGFARTGRWGAYQHYDVVPDLSTWAKSMGGGMPISAVVGKAEVMDAARPGTLGGTYGGNPVACAAALAVIDEIERLDLNKRAETIGKRIRERFEEWKKRCPAVADVRGLGAMQAIELVDPARPDEPGTDLLRQVQAACLKRGLLLISAGTQGNVLRVLAPLVITDEQLDSGLTILEEELFRAAPATSSTVPTRKPAGVP